MQEQTKKFQINIWQIVLLTILTPIIFVGCYEILYRSIIKIIFLEKMPILLSFLTILVLDIGLIFVVTKIPLKTKKLKIITAWLILVISASILTYLFVMWVLEGALA